MPALVPAPKGAANPDVVHGLLENDLLESLARMTLRGYQPSAFLLVRLTVKGGAKLDQFGGGRIDQFWGRAAEQK